MSSQQPVLRTFFAFAILSSSQIALADPITLSISTIASGSFGTQTFTSQQVTATASFATQDVYQFEAGQSQYYPPNTYSLDSNDFADLTVMVSVSGIGTGEGFGEYTALIAPHPFNRRRARQPWPSL
jgi:hypothetical protein